MDKQSVRESILEILVEASLAGQDLAGFEPVTDRETGGYQARCRRCGQTAWVGEDGLQYSLLEERCV